MLFSSLTFLCMFLPMMIIGYYVCPKRFRNTFLFTGSIVFYAFGEPKYLPIIFTTITISYIGALLIERFEHKKTLLTLFILLDLSLLFYFKYMNFFLENLNELFHQKWSLKVVLPLGISFYTFQALSYLIDVYRKQVKAEKNYLKIALYICLFPQLIAGPIVKYHDINEQLNCRQETFIRFYNGLKRFIIGLSKKVLIANTLGEIADKVLAQFIENEGVSVWIAWLGSICRTLQVYYDFSGYSDMAIGLGALFGFKFLENFNYPYISKSMSEYWRRWHISLGTWCKDYIYIPMGGSRVATWRIYFNLFVLFFVIGFWHGANWNFIAFGVLNAVFIMVERLTGYHKKNPSWIWWIPQYAYVLFAVNINTILGSSDTVSHALAYLKNLFGVVTPKMVGYNLVYYMDRIEMIILTIAIICCMPIFKNILMWGKECKICRICIDMWLFILLFLSCTQLAVSTYNPFIYFRF